MVSKTGDDKAVARMTKYNWKDEFSTDCFGCSIPVLRSSPIAIRWCRWMVPGFMGMSWNHVDLGKGWRGLRLKWWGYQLFSGSSWVAWSCGNKLNGMMMGIATFYKLATLMPKMGLKQAKQIDAGHVTLAIAWEFCPGPVQSISETGAMSAESRPHMMRIRGDMDVKKMGELKHCGMCQTVGHNQTTCPYHTYHVDQSSRLRGGEDDVPSLVLEQRHEARLTKLQPRLPFKLSIPQNDILMMLDYPILAIFTPFVNVMDIVKPLWVVQNMLNAPKLS
ncbi:hypothetical protein GOBAR_DD14636 [Gossypium barbadense]|nr:hypothetical protein GOBAR_DD14636 [Gossypium barbadense]